MSVLRSLTRTLVKNKMKKKGMTRICSDKVSYNPMNKQYSHTGSFFARHWREYI